MITKSSESLPKKIKSLFTTHHDEEYEDNNKRSSCHSSDSSSKKFKPTSWFTHIRNRSTSSSVSFSTSPTSYSNNYSTEAEDSDSYYQTSHSLFDSLSTELGDLYVTAKEELFYASESYGSIYYEGDKTTAENAYNTCEAKYKQIIHLLEGTTNAIKFKFQWEADIYQLGLKLNDLPQVTESIYD